MSKLVISMLFFYLKGVKTFTFIDSLRKKNTIFALLFIQLIINN